MVKSYYLDGTNKKAFILENEHGDKIMFTYARPAIYSIVNEKPIRIWDGYRINSGKHILKFDKNITKKVWEGMEVKSSPCTGKFVIDGKTNAIEANFLTKSFLIVNGEVILFKSNDSNINKVYRLSDTKFNKRYEQYITAFIGKSVTKEDWDKFEITDTSF